MGIGLGLNLSFSLIRELGFEKEVRFGINSWFMNGGLVGIRESFWIVLLGLTVFVGVVLSVMRVGECSRCKWETTSCGTRNPSGVRHGVLCVGMLMVD